MLHIKFPLHQNIFERVYQKSIFKRFNISNLDYQCGENITSDCRSEFDNARNNNKMDEFYHRCAEEGGSNPLRLRCRLCCDNEKSDNRFTGTN